LAELERFHRAHRALPITKALPIEALPVDTNTNEPAIPVETNESAVPVDINERNQLAVPSANATEPLISTLETDELAIPSANTTEPSMEDTFTLETDEPVETDEPAILFANTIEPSVEDTLIFNTLTLPPSPLRSIPATGFGQLHTLQRTNGSATPTYTSAAPTFTEFGRFQALQRTGVG
jgi:hypothetical protein